MSQVRSILCGTCRTNLKDSIIHKPEYLYSTYIEDRNESLVRLGVACPTCGNTIMFRVSIPGMCKAGLDEESTRELRRLVADHIEKSTPKEKLITRCSINNLGDFFKALKLAEADAVINGRWKQFSEALKRFKSLNNNSNILAMKRNFNVKGLTEKRFRELLFQYRSIRLEREKKAHLTKCPIHYYKNLMDRLKALGCDVDKRLWILNNRDLYYFLNEKYRFIDKFKEEVKYEEERRRREKKEEEKTGLRRV